MCTRDPRTGRAPVRASRSVTGSATTSTEHARPPPGLPRRAEPSYHDSVDAPSRLRDARRERLAALVAERFASLVRTARKAGAGDDAEDVVQDVVTRFLEHDRALPEHADALTAYLRRSVARDSARRRAEQSEALTDEPADPGPDVVDAIDDRRRVRAYARALARLPADIQPVLLLDVAGVDRRTIASRTGRSERSVKRVLAEHSGAVLALVVADIDGTTCTKLQATLDALAANGMRPRRGGEVARHLAACDACQLAYLEARRTRIAVGAVLLLPAGFARDASAAIVLRVARGALHLRRAALLPTAIGVIAVTPLFAFPHADPMPRHAPRAHAKAAPAPVAPETAYIAAATEPVTPHRLVPHAPTPSAHHRPKPPARAPVHIPSPAPPTVVRVVHTASVAPAKPAPAPACAFGSATLGC